MLEKPGILALSGWIAVWAGVATAATVRFDVVPAINVNATEVTVGRAEQVPYQVFVQVISDDIAMPDNNGLAFFSLGITTDFGIQQPPLDAFAPLIAQSFTSVQSLGIPQDDDLIRIGGGQNTLAGGAVIPGIGSNQQVLVGQGRFLTPTQLGSYRVGIASDSQANVLQPGSLTSAVQANVQAGPGFTVRVVETPGGGNGDTNGNGTTTQPTTLPSVEVDEPLQANLLLISLGGLIGGLLLVVALALVSPFAAMIALVLLPLLLIGLVLNF
jgi:hypothetical protein